MVVVSLSLMVMYISNLSHSEDLVELNLSALVVHREEDLKSKDKIYKTLRMEAIVNKCICLGKDKHLSIEEKALRY